MEAQLEGLPRAPADERAHLEGALDLRLKVRGPADRGLRVDEGGLLGAVEEHRRAVGGDGDHPLPLDEEVEQPAREDPGVADEADVVAEVGVEGEQRARVHGDGVALELEEEDVVRGAGEEDLTLAGHAHEVASLPGHGLLEHAAEVLRALVGEVHGALVGNHGALSGEHLGAQSDAKHLVRLERPALAGLLLAVVLVEDGAAHKGLQFTVSLSL